MTDDSAATPAAEAPAVRSATGEPGELAGKRPRRPPRRPPDRLAVAALAASLVGVHLVGIVLGHLALARIAAAGTGGRGLAVAALVIGYAGLVLVLSWWIVYFAVLAPVVTLPG